MFFIASIAYASAMRAPFVFDDLPAIRHNASIRQLSPLSIPLRPPPNTSVTGRPVVNVSLAVNYALNDALGVDERGENGTLGYHAVNVAIHILCGLLLFALVQRTLRHRNDDRLDAGVVAGFSTLLWLLHPIQTEAVEYVVQRSELLVSAFYLGTVYASVRAWDAHGRTRRWCWYLAAVAMCALGMASKEVMVSAPIIVVFYDRAFRSTSWRELFTNVGRRWFYAALVFVTVIVGLTVAANARAGSAGFGLGITWYEYLYTQAWAVTRYLRLLAWPSGLTFDYGETPISGWIGLPGLVLLTACAVATMIAWRRPRWMWLGFLGAWFFLILAPSSSVVPIKTEIAAERRIYLASAAVIVLTVVALETWRLRAGFSLRRQRIGLGALAAVLALLTFVRSATYADAEHLYRDVIAKAPKNPRGYVGAGLAMFESPTDRSADAEAMFRQAITVDSTYFPAWEVLGTTELARSNWTAAEYLFGRALRLQPENRDASDGIARAYIALRQPDSAMRYVDALGGRDVDALWSLGTLLLAQGRGATAVPYLEQITHSAPSAFAIATLSVAYAQANRVNDAVKAAEEATASAGDTASVYLAAGRAMLIARRIGEARTFLKEAVALDPSSEAAHRALAEAEEAKR